MMTTKAYNSRIIASWLAECLEDAASKPAIYVDARFPVAAMCMLLVCSTCSAFCSTLHKKIWDDSTRGKVVLQALPMFIQRL